MNNTTSNPWNFGNTDPNMTSPNGKYQLEYEGIGEIAMSGPLGGTIFWKKGANEKILLQDWAGGPVVWSEDSYKLAIPTWVKGRVQQICIVDFIQLSIVLFSKTYSLLQLEQLTNNCLSGIISPVYKPKPLSLDLNTATIQQKVPLLS